MKATLTSLLIWFLCYPVTAQSNAIESILKLPEIKIDYYTPTEIGSKLVYLPMSYGKSAFSINQLLVINELKNAQVARIDLVYSDYPSTMDFTPLNRKRLESLYKLFPGAFNKKIEFRKIRQTGFNNKQEASYLPHGFYIYYRLLPSVAESAKEIKRIKKLLTTKSTGYSEEKILDTMPKTCAEWGFYEDSSVFHALRENFTRSVIKISTSEGIKTKLITEEFLDYVKNYDSVYYVMDVNEDSCESWDGVYRSEAYESVVEEVFKRNKWDNAMIIADVTGSMYPYSAQLLTWLKLKMSDGVKRHFIFFNDGDNKRDEEKIIGKTGGIYNVFSAKYDEVEKMLETAMLNGSGGDAPENNIEALINGNKLCAACDTIVMIADNWAPVKDISLLVTVTKPVKIILCGVYGSINTDYLNIARKTKGSLHLIERDIYELSKMREGDVIEIKGRKYKIIDGDFKEISVIKI